MTTRTPGGSETFLIRLGDLRFLAEVKSTSISWRPLIGRETPTHANDVCFQVVGATDLS